MSLQPFSEQTLLTGMKGSEIESSFDQNTVAYAIGEQGMSLQPFSTPITSGDTNIESAFDQNTVAYAIGEQGLSLDPFTQNPISSFEKDLAQIFHKAKFPQTETQEAVKNLLTRDPLDDLQIPPWQEHHLNTLLEELYQLAKNYFGNTSFAEGMDEVLEELTNEDRANFIGWLNQSSVGKLWAIG
jgi:hypothetical protein